MSTFFGGFDMFVWIWSNAVFRLLLAERSAGTALKRKESCTKRQPGANFIFQTKDEKKETKILQKISSISCRTQNSFLPFKMYSEDILDCGQAREKCTKLIEHFRLDPKLFPGVSVYFLNRTKLFCGKHQVVKQKKQKILFSLLA